MRQGTAILLAGGASAAALLSGGAFNPGPDHPRTAAWYARLRKSSLTPPGPVFGIAWTALDGLLAYTGYRLLRRAPSGARTAALSAWLFTLLGIPAYCWLFFGRRRADEALGVTGIMLASSVGLTATAAQVDRQAKLASVPLIFWLVFASVLQEEVWRRNN